MSNTKEKMDTTKEQEEYKVSTSSYGYTDDEADYCKTCQFNPYLIKYPTLGNYKCAECEHGKTIKLTIV